MFFPAPQIQFDAEGKRGVTMRGVCKKTSARSATLERASKLILGGVFAVASCGKSHSPTLQELKDSTVTAAPDADKSFSAANGEIRILSRKKLEELVKNGEVKPMAVGQQANPESLVVAMPKATLGKLHYFGGVIVSTDDKTSDVLGGLKLTDLTPSHVYPRTEASRDGTRMTLLLEGCASNCQPGFAQRDLIARFPVSAENADKIFIDFSVIGRDMNLVQIFDPEGEYTNLNAVAASTVAASYSLNTLLFDVLGQMEEKAAAPGVLDFFKLGKFAPALIANKLGRKVQFTTRWYLKEKVENKNFQPQVPTSGVGYFLTERYAAPHILKHAVVDEQNNPEVTHYFLKNIPDDVKSAFQESFEAWNDVFEKSIGKRILTYEFLDANDPLADIVVTGDVRLNVVEWDLNALAPYGGLGPSIADQETGMMLSSNVLIQGPTIVKIYSKWFQVNKEASALRAVGLNSRADDLLKSSRAELVDDLKNDRARPRFELSLNQKLKFNVNSQDPRLKDETSNLDFEIVPENVTYAQYMHGYFRDMLTHELGHNMGLRHNFRGNLFAADKLTQDKVSASIMEYLSRPYRYLDSIGAYDHMAIAYGYGLKSPARRDMYCTDEEVGNLDRKSGSAECSKDDAESNPYANLTARLVRARDLYIGNGIAEGDIWNKEQLTPVFEKYADGVLLYGESAERSMSTWLRFFAAPGRPAKNVEAIKDYVAKTVAQVACESKLEENLKAQYGDGTPAEARSLANLEDFRHLLQDKVKKALGDGFAADVNCIQ